MNAVNGGDQPDTIFTYLLSLPQESFNSLYENKWVCKAVFRSLSDLAKQYVMQLVLCDGNVSIDKLSSTLVANNKLAKAQHAAALQKLINLRVVIPTGKDQKFIRMNPLFQKTFKQCLVSYDTNVAPANVKIDKQPSLSKLERYAREKWEGVLLYSIGSQQGVDVSQAIKVLLEWSNLVQKDESGGVKITTEGFQFLLQDQKTQVWKLLKKYLDSAEQRQQNKIELLQFLFMLSFLETGRPYLLKTLTPTQLALLKDLRGFGLVYNKKDSEVYYPTQFATGLIHENGASWTQKDRGYIIVETNYRVYAYTSSVLDIDLLSLFVSMEMRTPNLVVGLISRESVITAFKSGITADQILSYLYLHAHPHMKKKTPVIPETVADQIRLWEKERTRVKQIRSTLYDKFPSLESFLKVEQYAKSIGVHLWSSREKMILIVRQSGHEAVRNFIKRNV